MQPITQTPQSAWRQALHASTIFIAEHELLFYVVMLFVVRGASLNQGLAIDDYEFVAPNDDFYRLMSNGRFTQVVLFWLSNFYQVSLSDIAPLAYIAGLITQAWLVTTVRKIIGASASWRAMLMGICIATHPYATEIFTFQAGLIGYTMSIIAMTGCLKIVQNGQGFKSICSAAGLLLLGLWSYQACLNYVLSIGLFLFVQIALHDADGSVQRQQDKADRRNILTRLIASSALAVVAFMATMKPVLRVYGVEGCPRSKHIALDDISPRIEAMQRALKELFWISDILFSDHARKMILVFTVLSSVCLIANRVRQRIGDVRLSVAKAAITIMALLAILPILSIGLIVFFNDFWPVPRAIAHVAITSFTLGLVAEADLGQKVSGLWDLAVGVVLVPIAVLFAVSNLQTMAEQKRINSWDKLRANRIVYRLESLPSFRRDMAVSFVGGGYAYPAFIRTRHGDLNISAFSVGVPRHPVINAVSGYQLRTTNQEQTAQAEQLCHGRFASREADVVSELPGQAVVCLQ